METSSFSFFWFVGAQPGFIHYIPIATTVLSAIFFGLLARRYLERGGTHLAWWAAGVFCYGVGTALEGSITLFGNTIALTKTWYIAGALFGGYPLAQGTVYLLLKRRTANILTFISLPFIALVALLVLLSPVNMVALEPHRPTGAVLGWTWVRALTPLINSYAALFLIGGAFLSAWRYFRSASNPMRSIGNTLIAVGAILPGIGGGMAKAGHVEALYVGEFVGIILIWAGYNFCVREPAPTAGRA
jgi:hypothetical protein